MNKHYIFVNLSRNIPCTAIFLMKTAVDSRLYNLIKNWSLHTVCLPGNDQRKAGLRAYFRIPVITHLYTWLTEELKWAAVKFLHKNFGFTSACRKTIKTSKFQLRKIILINLAWREKNVKHVLQLPKISVGSY